MNHIKFTLPIILFVLTAASGFWVAKAGKPYQTGILTLHKLASLATVVFTVIALINLLKIAPAQSIIILLIVVAGLSVIALFATGAVMSIQKTVNSTWLLIHRIAPFLLAGSTTAAILLLLKK
jgi:hypothetical protein